MKKTKLTRSLMAACSIVALSAVMYGCVHDGGDDAPATDMSGTPDPAPDPAAPVDVMMYVDVSGEAEQDALLAKLPLSGTSDTLTIAAGGTGTRNGVNFTCMSAYPCTVTVTNSLGTILAEVSTQKLPDADDPTVMAMVPVPPDALPELNPANAASIARNLDNTIEDSTVTPPGSPHGNASTSVGGLGLDDFGAYSDDMLSITSDLDPNTAGMHVPRVVDLTNGDVTTARMGGSTIMAGTDNDETTDNPDSVALADWEQTTLFRDWGDTAGMGDGGFETGALTYNNMEGPTAAPFDGDLADMFANTYVHNWFDLTVDLDGDATSDTVAGIGGTGNWGTPLQMISITVEGSQAAAVQINVPAVTLRNAANRYRGTYFGAPGTFACIGAPADGCVIARSATGDEDFRVADSDADTDGIQITGDGVWDFTPDPDAMVMVPDQDWVVFGAWLTAPDSLSGQHRVGVFYDGMQTYGRDNSGGDLNGTASYSGGATGVYTHTDGTNTNSGLFTARASLTANFDVAVDANDNMLSGRIDNFRDTAGRFLGADTAADPNDPVSGGENDWVVMLGATAIDAMGTFGTAGSVTGSADGVQWTDGEWAAQFYGPEVDADMDPIFPSAVAGQFRAEISAQPDDNTNVPTAAVVGAFGADLDD